MADEDALTLTSQKLNLPVDAILDALKIESVYRKTFQSLKDRRKAEKKQQIARLALEKEKQEEWLCRRNQSSCEVDRSTSEKILWEYVPFVTTSVHLAEKYRVAPSTIIRIVNDKTWQHIER